MALTVTNSGTLTADGSEQTLGAERVDGKTYVLQVDLSNMTSADVIEIRVKGKVTSGGATRMFHKAVTTGVQAQAYPGLQTPPIVAPHSVTFTLKQTAGTNRAFPYDVIAL